MDADKKCKRRAPVTSAPPASMRVRSSGRVAWCSRVSIWCPVSNSCPEGVLVEKQATEPRTSSGSPIHGRFGALGVFFLPPHSFAPGTQGAVAAAAHCHIWGKIEQNSPRPNPVRPRTARVHGQSGKHRCGQVPRCNRRPRPRACSPGPRARTHKRNRSFPALAPMAPCSASPHRPGTTLPFDRIPFRDSSP